jgi:hypothetical protein
MIGHCSSTVMPLRAALNYQLLARPLRTVQVLRRRWRQWTLEGGISIRRNWSGSAINSDMQPLCWRWHVSKRGTGQIVLSEMREY